MQPSETILEQWKAWKNINPSINLIWTYTILICNERWFKIYYVNLTQKDCKILSFCKILVILQKSEYLWIRSLLCKLLQKINLKKKFAKLLIYYSL